jgi:tetraacyldisaccharide 4'-kinase
MRTPEFWGPGKGGAPAALLQPVAWSYSLAAQARRAFTAPTRFSAPVICVGNVIAGGAGKTPTALALAKLLSDCGAAPHFLTRGHGGTARGPLRVDPKRHTARMVGDEPLLLARRAPTWLARHRPAGARAAIAGGADMIIMDDGLQNPSLAKDISLIVVDGGFGFGNGRLLPAGPLREPIGRGLARADAVVLVGPDEVGAGEALAPHGVPLLRAELTPALNAQKLRGRAVVAFAGIGRPAKFFRTLDAIGCEVIGRVAFADHHRYTPNEIMTLVENAGSHGAIAVTTEKDWVRLPEEAKAMVQSVAVTLEWQDPEAVRKVMAPVLADLMPTGGDNG